MSRRFLISAPALALWSLTLCAQGVDLEKAANQLAGRITSPTGTMVAVVDFTDLQGRVTELGRYYSEELSVALVNAPGNLKVIDRGHLRALLAEHKLQSSGLIDDRTAAELGRIAGVTVLVTGSVTELADSVRLSLKAMNTKTAAIQAAASVSLPKSASTMALLRRDVVDAGSEAGAATSSSTRLAAAPNARMFQNDFLIAGADDVSLRRQGDDLILNLALSLENKTSAEEYIAQSGAVTLMDSAGRAWRFMGCAGLTNVSTNFPAKSYTRIAAGSRQIVVLTFSVKSPAAEPGVDARASFALGMLRHRGPLEGHGEERFSIGISGLPVTGSAQAAPAAPKRR